MEKRVDYIDVIKGIMIFGVVWVHTSCPRWLIAILVNSIFFLLSGIFFTHKPLKTFLYEKVRGILVPFLFFYLISYPCKIIEYYWDNQSLKNFDWFCIFDVFTFSSRTDYICVNVTLSFLICLFSVQVLYYFVSYLEKKWILVISLLCFVLRDIYFSVPSFFMVNAACYYMFFFSLGNIIGKPLIESLKDIRFRKTTLALSLFLFAVLFIPISTITGSLFDVIYHLKLLMVFFILMCVASWFNGNRYLSLFRFYGENSLIVLGTHMYPLIFLKRITNAIFGVATPLMGFIQSVIVMALMYVVILFCNKYIPFLVGKKQPKVAVNV